MLSVKEKKYRNYLLFAAVMTLLCALGLFAFLRKNEMKVEDCACQKVQQSQAGYQFHVDNARIVDNSVQLAGWIVREGVEQKIIERHIVLQGHTSQKQLKIPTEIVRRPDLNDHFADDLNYTYGGFFATVAMDELNWEKEDYTVFVLDVSDEDEQLVEIATSLKEEMKRATDVQKTSQ